LGPTFRVHKSDNTSLTKGYTEHSRQKSGNNSSSHISRKNFQFFINLSHDPEPRVGFGAHVCYHCRISPPHFLAECHKRRLNQGSFVLLFFRLSTLFDLYLVFACLFSCTALFVSISQVTGCEDRLRNNLLCVGWGVKLYSLTHSLTHDPEYSRSLTA